MIAITTVLLLNLAASPGNSGNSWSMAAFAENVGQWDSRVRFRADLGAGTAWITDNGLVFDTYRLTTPTLDLAKPNGQFEAAKNTSKHGDVLSFGFAGSHGRTYPVERTAGKLNFIQSEGAENRVRSASRFRRAITKNAYNGIDILWTISDGELRFDFQVAPGADLSQVKIALDEVHQSRVEDGELVIGTRFGPIRIGKLFAYQNGMSGLVEVSCEFAPLQDNAIGLKVKGYDRRKPLTIDPTLYATYLGSNLADSAGAHNQVLTDGSLLVTGGTASREFPTTEGAYDSTGTYSTDAILEPFVARIAADGKSLVFCTYLESSGWAYGSDVDQDGNGNIVAFGGCSGNGFPTTLGAYRRRNSGALDCYVAILSPEGDELVASSLLGGSGSEQPSALVLTGSNRDAVAVAGYTSSSGSVPFPLEGYSHDRTIEGVEGFLACFEPGLRKLRFSTLVGGPGTDVLLDIDTDGYYLYICGGADSRSLPDYYSSSLSEQNAIIGVYTMYGYFRAGGYFGGARSEYFNSIAYDRANRMLYAGGLTYSTDWPCVYGAVYSSKTYPAHEAMMLSLYFDPYWSLFYPPYAAGTYLRGAEAVPGGATDGISASVLYDLCVDPFGRVLVGLQGKMDFKNLLFRWCYNMYGRVCRFDPWLQEIDQSFNVFGTKIVKPEDRPYEPPGSPVFHGLSVDSTGSIYATGQTDQAIFQSSPDAIQASAPAGVNDIFAIRHSFADLEALRFSPVNVIGGQSTMAKIRLSDPAPLGGATIELKSSSGKATLPANVTVRESETSITFPVATASVKAATPVQVTASYGGKSVSSRFQIDVAKISKLTFTPATVTGGEITEMAILLNGPAPAGGLWITMSKEGDAGSAITLLEGDNVFIPAGATGKTISVKTTPVALTFMATIRGYVNGKFASAQLTVRQPRLEGMTLSPSSVRVGELVTLTITLSGKPPSGGQAISIVYSPAGVVSFGVVKVPLDDKSVTVTTKALAVTETKTVSVTASYKGTSDTAYVRVVK